MSGFARPRTKHFAAGLVVCLTTYLGHDLVSGPETKGTGSSASAGQASAPTGEASTAARDTVVPSGRSRVSRSAGRPAPPEARRLREAAQREAERSLAEFDYGPSDNRTLGYRLMIDAGFSPDQWPALETLWTRESGWNHLAQNPTSGAYGIPQSLPGSKMASAGADWKTNPVTQITWGLGYIRDRYGSPVQALSHSDAVGWY